MEPDPTPLDPEIKEEQIKNAAPIDALSTSELWDQIGYHKPIAGFWYNIVLTLLGIALSAVLFGYLIGFFYPYPDSLGMRDIAFGYFSLLFTLFDIGTGAVMGRFIPEVNIKNPEKMMHYIQYFIWYQMITGLIQTTAVSIYALFYAPQGTMAYTIWIMLIASTTQYPGFLGCFRNVLDSLQQYDKTRFLGFITGTVMQTFTSYLFLYLGRIYGENNPIVGPILGIAIGAAIGGYVDDFFATVLGAYYFNKILKAYGITAMHCFRVEFTWEEIKPLLVYSLKTSLPVFITGPINYASFLITVSYVPQYTTLMFLSIVGGSIGDVMGWFGGAGITALVSESFMNDKKMLTQYYIGQEVRFNTFLICFFAPLILILIRVMPIAYVALNMAQYVIATIYIFPRLVRFCIERYFAIPGSVMYGANKPEFGIIMGIIHTILDFIVKYCYLVVFRLPLQLGLEGTIYLLEWGHLPLAITVHAILYTYVHKKIIKIKIPWGQIIIGFLLPAAITYGTIYFLVDLIFFPLNSQYGFFVALGPGVLSIVFCLFFVYMPLTALCGAWDPTNLDEFRKAALMSGPSKFIVMPLYRVCAKFCSISRLHGRFAMDVEKVVEHARELLIIKQKNREELKEKLA